MNSMPLSTSGQVQHEVDCGHQVHVRGLGAAPRNDIVGMFVESCRVIDDHLVEGHLVAQCQQLRVRIDTRFGGDSGVRLAGFVPPILREPFCAGYQSSHGVVRSNFDLRVQDPLRDVFLLEQHHIRLPLSGHHEELAASRSVQLWATVIDVLTHVGFHPAGVACMHVWAPVQADNDGVIPVLILQELYTAAPLAAVCVEKGAGVQVYDEILVVGGRANKELAPVTLVQCELVQDGLRFRPTIEVAESTPIMYGSCMCGHVPRPRPRAPRALLESGLCGSGRARKQNEAVKRSGVLNVLATYPSSVTRKGNREGCTHAW